MRQVIHQSVRCYRCQRCLMSVADEYKDYMEMSEDLLRRSRLLVVCGTVMDESVLVDIATAKRFHVVSSTMRGVLSVDKSKNKE